MSYLWGKSREDMSTEDRKFRCAWCGKEYVRDFKKFNSRKYDCEDCRKAARKNAMFINSKLSYKREQAKRLMATSTYYEILIKNSVNSDFLKSRLEEQITERFFWE